MSTENVFNRFKKKMVAFFNKKINALFSVEIVNGGPQSVVEDESPEHAIIGISEPMYGALKCIAISHHLSTNEVIQQFFKLGFLVNHIEQTGGKFGIKNKDAKRIEYCSFLKDLDSKRQVARLLDEVLNTLPKKEED